MTKQSGESGLGRREGVLTDWNDDRGFGFIAPTHGDPRTFVHISAFPRGGRPRAGVAVTYVESRGERNRSRASAVQYVGRAPRSARPGLGVAVVVAAVFLLGVLALALRGWLWIWIPGGYLLMSLLTLLSYWFDKSAATTGEWRTPEITLHLQALAGGWPGALVARHLLRHKTVKRSFVGVFWLTVAVNLLILGWLVVLTRTGVF